MMKKIFLIVFLYVGYSGLMAQNARNTVVGKVVYACKYMPDSTNSSNYINEEYELDFGKLGTVFYSYTNKNILTQEKKINDSLSTKGGKRIINGKIINSGEGSFLKKGSEERFYIFFNKKTVYQIRPFPFSRNPYAIKTTMKNIDWIIDTITKNIGGYLCQKATCKSFGRTYTAWFATDLPFSYGPRKLYGLPGLILEAYDNKNQIIYNFEKIELYPNPKTVDSLSLPFNAIITTQRKFDKALSAFYKNPEAFTNGVNIFTLKYPDGKPLYPRNPPKSKNPIDLE